MKIKIIQIGKNKDCYVDECVAEFTKRLRPFVKLELVTLKEIVATKAFTKERCIELEGEEISRVLDAEKKLGNSCVIMLDEHGKELTSVEFAGFLGKFADEGRTIIFVIGGPYGLHENVKKKANILLSFSRMTFTHQMIRLFLLEQIYRGVSILKGKEYHNV